MARALFVTNQLKTAFYEAVARRMVDLGTEVSWISVSDRWTQFLIEKRQPQQPVAPLDKTVAVNLKVLTVQFVAKITFNLLGCDHGRPYWRSL